MFSRRRMIVAVIALAAIAPLLLLLAHEPSHGGRSLSEWLADAGSDSAGQAADGSDSPAAQAAAAIRAIGPKALPRLVRMLEAEETALGGSFRELRNQWLPPEKRLPSHWELRRRGLIGLQLLGPAAALAVPDIIRLLGRDQGRAELWYLLELIGPGSVAAAPLLERSYPNFSSTRPDQDFHPAWLASDLRMLWGGEHHQLVTDQLAATSGLFPRVACLWALRKDAEFARQMCPAIGAMIDHPAETPVLKRAAMHALGRIPNADPTFIERAAASFEAEFGPLPVDRILNGSFTQLTWSGTNQPPDDPKAPADLHAPWLTSGGVVGRNTAPAWPGLKIELGPRFPPGAISQVFRTTPGERYEVQLEAATGRNRRARITVGDLDETFVPASADPALPSKLSFQFRAVSLVTTLMLSALDFEGSGPFIDNVVVRASKLRDVTGNR